MFLWAGLCEVRGLGAQALTSSQFPVILKSVAALQKTKPRNKASV